MPQSQWSHCGNFCPCAQGQPPSITSSGPATRGCWPGSHAEDLRGSRVVTAAAALLALAVPRHSCRILLADSNMFCREYAWSRRRLGFAAAAAPRPCFAINCNFKQMNLSRMSSASAQWGKTSNMLLGWLRIRSSRLTVLKCSPVAGKTIHNLSPTDSWTTVEQSGLARTGRRTTFTVLPPEGCRPPSCNCAASDNPFNGFMSPLTPARFDMPVTHSSCWSELPISRFGALS